MPSPGHFPCCPCSRTSRLDVRTISHAEGRKQAKASSHGKRGSVNTLVSTRVLMTNVDLEPDDSSSTVLVSILLTFGGTTLKVPCSLVSQARVLPGWKSSGTVTWKPHRGCARFTCL
eukprot:1494133-Pleurochrysis_carterae.AAC.2